MDEKKQYKSINKVECTVCSVGGGRQTTAKSSSPSKVDIDETVSRTHVHSVDRHSQKCVTPNFFPKTVTFRNFGSFLGESYET